MSSSIKNGYDYAKEIYANNGVDVDAAIQNVSQIPISMNCWQGDDVVGFDADQKVSGGIAATGNYMGRATNEQQLKQDIEKAYSLIPGTKKLNLHASYANLGKEKIDRDEYNVRHFQTWIDWANENKVGLDFNPSFFGHKNSSSNFTLSHKDKEIRDFWIRHGICCREIATEFGKQTGKVSVVNYWMPDGYKDMPACSSAPRERMIESLDKIFEKQLDEKYILEAIESKLFGLGIESYTVASHEFSMGYALTRKKLYCMDAGHFHPTEVVSAKISALLQYCDKVLLHVSRPVRWDSDHVVCLDDELQNTMNEIVRNNYQNRVILAPDFFDASINRIAAWTIGMRNIERALLKAFLEPKDAIITAENQGDYTSRFALIEEAKSLPFGAIWDYYCQSQNVPTQKNWLDEIKNYEKNVLAKR